jgi:hypothetical protein
LRRGCGASSRDCRAPVPAVPSSHAGTRARQWHFTRSYARTSAALAALDPRVGRILRSGRPWGPPPRSATAVVSPPRKRSLPDAQPRRLDLPLSLRSAVHRTGCTYPVPRPRQPRGTNPGLQVNDRHPRRRDRVAASEDQMGIAPSVGVHTLDVDHTPLHAAAVGDPRWTSRGLRLNLRRPARSLSSLGELAAASGIRLLPRVGPAAHHRQGQGRKAEDCERLSAHTPPAHPEATDVAPF